MTDLLEWALSGERAYGKGINDTVNRALRQLLTLSGYDPDEVFRGYVPGPPHGFHNVKRHGAIGDGSTDDTVAFQSALDEATNSGGVVIVPAGEYVCAQLNDLTPGRLEIRGMNGAVIKTVDASWIKVDPTGAKVGVTLKNLRYDVTSGNVVMTPLIWLEGSGSGGIINIDIDNLTFNGADALFDCVWLRACFNGSVQRIFGTSLGGARGIVYEALNFNSGNIHFDEIALAGAAVTMQIGGAYSSAANGELLNNVILQNVKCVRSPNGGVYRAVALTAGASAAAGTLTADAADVTAIAANLALGKPQWVVCGDATIFGNVHRISAAAGTTLTLNGTLRAAIANGTVLPIGTFGVVIGANVRGVVNSGPQYEYVGAGMIVAGGQMVRQTGAVYGSEVVRGTLCTHGSQNVKDYGPIYSKANTGLTLMETTVQGTNARCALIEPAGYSSGAGPAAFLTDGAAGNNNNRYVDEENSTFARTTALNPLDGTAANRPKAARYGELIQYTSDNAVYVCTVYADPPTWVKVGAQ